jgi:hypothetical protein
MPGYGATDAAARGLTFGLSDVVGPAIHGAHAYFAGDKPWTDPVRGIHWLGDLDLSDYSEAYQQRLKSEQQAAAQYATAHPVLSNAANLVGMLAAAPRTLVAQAPAAARGLIGQIARSTGFGAGAGAAEAVPQATQEPTWTESARDLALGTGTGGAAGLTGGAAPAVLGQVARYAPVAAARAIPAAIGTAIGEHFFPGGEGLFGAYLGEHTLGSLGKALEPYATKLGTTLQGWLPTSLGGLPAIPGAYLTHRMLPGQP